jgi:hypothetical protein
MNYSRFKNPQLEEEFTRNGYAMIKGFLSEGEVAKLFDLFSSLYTGDATQQGFWNSLYNIDREKGLEVSKEILAVLQSHIEEHFENYCTPIGTFMVKRPNPESASDIHRDYSSLDETEFQYRNLWIPLVDVTADNGALFVLEGSHKIFNQVLPMFTPWPYEHHRDLLHRHIKTILANAGDLVVYQDRTLHGSKPNFTDKPRPVVHLGIFPPEAQLCYHHLNENREVEVYHVSQEFYFKGNFKEDLKSIPLHKKYPFEYPNYSAKDIERLLGVEPAAELEVPAKPAGMFSRIKSLFQ